MSDLSIAVNSLRRISDMLTMIGPALDKNTKEWQVARDMQREARQAIHEINKPRSGGNEHGSGEKGLQKD